jgi:hypothetical protein
MKAPVRIAARAFLLLLLASVLAGGTCTWAYCSGDGCDHNDDNNDGSTTAVEIGTFGGWDLGPVLSPLPGVVSVQAGWNGGKLPFFGSALAPYTGHLRATRVHFDPSSVSYAELVRAVRSARADTLRMTVFAHSPGQEAAAAHEFPADSLPRLRLRTAGTFTPH